MGLYLIIVIICSVLLGLSLIAVRDQRRIIWLRSQGQYPQPGQVTDAWISQLVHEGHYIEAIRAYRELHGVGLKDAKAAIDRMRA